MSAISILHYTALLMASRYKARRWHHNAEIISVLYSVKYPLNKS